MAISVLVLTTEEMNVDFPVPKFRINDSVWAAKHGNLTEIIETCPDCLGTREWSVTTPAGETFGLDCGTCRDGYRPVGTIKKYAPNASAVQLTIGSILVDTSNRAPVRYMALETGVGSGTLWHEECLFREKSDALAEGRRLAQAHAEAENARHEQRRALNKKETRSKPTLEQRRIKDLEKQLAAMNAPQANAELVAAVIMHQTQGGV